MIVKSIAIKVRGGRSGRRVVKAVVLTSGGLPGVLESGLNVKLKSKFAYAFTCSQETTGPAGEPAIICASSHADYRLGCVDSAILRR